MSDSVPFGFNGLSIPPRTHICAFFRGVEERDQIMVPFLGDIFDAAWKANVRNLALLDAHFRDPKRTVRSSRLFVAALNPEKRWAVFPLDPATGTLGDALVSDPVYDVVAEAVGGLRRTSGTQGSACSPARGGAAWHRLPAPRSARKRQTRPAAECGPGPRCQRASWPRPGGWQ